MCKFKVGEKYKSRNGEYGYEFVGTDADSGKLVFWFLWQGKKYLILKGPNGESIPDGGCQAHETCDVMPNVEKKSLWLTWHMTNSGLRFLTSYSENLVYARANAKDCENPFFVRHDFEDGKLVKVEIENV